ncbi:hypothetical protein [Moraxella lacunata]
MWVCHGYLLVGVYKIKKLDWVNHFALFEIYSSHIQRLPFFAL